MGYHLHNREVTGIIERENIMLPRQRKNYKKNSLSVFTALKVIAITAFADGKG